MATPLPPEKRAAIIRDLRLPFLNLGRNEIARRHGVSPSTVTKIAREEHHFFPRATQTAEATMTRQALHERARAEREHQLLMEYLALPTTIRHDGTETRRSKKITRQLDRLRR